MNGDDASGGHDWVVRLNDDGDPYEVCTHCGKQAHWNPQLAIGPEGAGPEN